MPETAENLSELHALHQRAKAIRDRLISGPKTLATREAVLANRKDALEKAQKALKDLKAHNKNREVQVQQIDARIDELKTKRNSFKKQVDYDAVTNQMAHDQASKAKIEDEILQAFETVESQTAELAKLEADFKALEADVAKLRADLEAQKAPQETQLKELEAAIAAAETIIPPESRDQYRRVVKHRGPDAMAAVEIQDKKRRDTASCGGCYVALTTQMLTKLYQSDLAFCLTCGRILYLSAEDLAALKPRDA